MTVETQFKSIKVVVSGTPVAKGRGRLGKLANGRPTIFTPANTRSYESTIRHTAAQVMGGNIPFDRPLRCEVLAYLPVPQSFSQKKRAAALAGELRPVVKPDVDNYVKSALDGLNSIVFVDDKQVVELYAAKRYCERPRLEIIVTQLGVV